MVLSLERRSFVSGDVHQRGSWELEGDVNLCVTNPSQPPVTALFTLGSSFTRTSLFSSALELLLLSHLASRISHLVTALPPLKPFN